MKRQRQLYTVRQVAKMAGVSVRTLHHYDQLGLLRAAQRTAAGYRLYGARELLLLQQIMFYRELELPLTRIRELLTAGDFDIRRALREHRAALAARQQQTQRLLRTIDTTLRRLEENGQMGMDEEQILDLYDGFSRDEARALHREAEQRWGGTAAWAESMRKTKNMSKERLQAISVEADAAARTMATLRDRPVSDPEIQRLVDAHYRWILNFWTPDENSYKGLGQMYADDPRFRKYYENYGENFADFMAAAIAYYADHTLAAKG